MKIVRKKSTAVDNKSFYFLEDNGKFLCGSGEWCNTYEPHDHIKYSLPCTYYGFGCTTKARLLFRLGQTMPEELVRYNKHNP